MNQNPSIAGLNTGFCNKKRQKLGAAKYAGKECQKLPPPPQWTTTENKIITTPLACWDFTASILHTWILESSLPPFKPPTGPSKTLHALCRDCPPLLTGTEGPSVILLGISNLYTFSLSSFTRTTGFTINS